MKALIHCVISNVLFDAIYCLVYCVCYCNEFFTYSFNCSLLKLSLTWRKISLLIFLSQINPFSPNAPFLYPQKASENGKVFWCFQGIKKGCTENKWVKSRSNSISVASQVLSLLLRVLLCFFHCYLNLNLYYSYLYNWVTTYVNIN